MIVIGVDTHKRSHTLVALDAATGAERGQLTIPASDQGTFEAVVANVRSAYLGKDLTVRLSLCCLLSEGHLLVEDHPGVGKTTLAKALARSLGLDFGRVQLTADLLPADITGAVVFDRDTGVLAFRPGPIFTNVLLADELNRASPKAQSALLEPPPVLHDDRFPGHLGRRAQEPKEQRPAIIGFLAGYVAGRVTLEGHRRERSNEIGVRTGEQSREVLGT